MKGYRTGYRKELPHRTPTNSERPINTWYFAAALGYKTKIVEETRENFCPTPRSKREKLTNDGKKECRRDFFEGARRGGGYVWLAFLLRAWGLTGRSLMRRTSFADKTGPSCGLLFRTTAIHPRPPSRSLFVPFLSFLFFPFFFKGKTERRPTTTTNERNYQRIL